MSSGTRRQQPDSAWQEKPQPRVPLLGVLVGTAVLIVGLISLYLVMRTVGLDYGGACAVDGPYEIRPGQECEAGIFASAYVSIAVSVTGGLLLLWSSKRYDGGLIAWVAAGTLATLFFGALGVSFRKVAAALPASAEAISDFNAVGVAFVVLAVACLGVTLATILYGDRIGRLDHPKPSMRAWLAWLGAVVVGLWIGSAVGALIIRAA